jgi:hypothetical protein
VHFEAQGKMAVPLLSIAPSSTDAVAAPPGPPPGSRRAWLREPLLHFIVLGGLLFAVDRIVVGRANDPHLIVVSGSVDHEAIEQFRASSGRKPTSQELDALRRVWLDNEILYREGLALQVDKGDDAIRERVIFKALSVIDSNVKLPNIDDKGLREWFEAHRAKYDQPARYDFDEAALSGESGEAPVRAFVAELNAGARGDAKAGLRVFKGRPLSNLVQSYGPEFATALAAAKPGEWNAYKTKDGWRAIRLGAVTQSVPALFESLRGVVLQDWKDAVASDQRTAAVRALGKKYKIKHEVSDEETGE